MKLNLKKMRKQLVRDMDNQTSITVGAFDNDVEAKLEDWRETFIRHMKLKHGDNLKNFMIAQEQEYDNESGRQVKFRIEAILIGR